MASSSSTTDARARPLPDRIEVGRVVRAHGVRGELLVESLSDVPERFEKGARLELVLADGSRRTLTVSASHWPMPGRLHLSFESVGDRESAAALRGARIEIERAEVPAAPEGEYWQFELLGCRAYDERAGELGEVVEVTESGAGPLLVVAMTDGRRLPLPFVERFLVSVDAVGRRIDWRLPEGLIEACASRS